MFAIFLCACLPLTLVMSMFCNMSTWFPACLQFSVPRFTFCKTKLALSNLTLVFSQNRARCPQLRRNNFEDHRDFDQKVFKGSNKWHLHLQYLIIHEDLLHLQLHRINTILSSKRPDIELSNGNCVVTRQEYIILGLFTSFTAHTVLEFAMNLIYST